MLGESRWRGQEFRGRRWSITDLRRCLWTQLTKHLKITRARSSRTGNLELFEISNVGFSRADGRVLFDLATFRTENLFIFRNILTILLAWKFSIPILFFKYISRAFVLLNFLTKISFFRTFEFLLRKIREKEIKINETISIISLLTIKNI